ncbi:paraquat-inducible protein A [Neptunomonas japonica]|uniref:paraquat-inducible protein A n=1 Tax=Neptunomonas japonica TaxID=417574 RepID=UPI0003F80A96|nr:paraquat-inducible protein A [Neptunomonas japonica]
MTDRDLASTQPGKFWVCPECDLLMNRRAIPNRHEAHCPRCQSLIVSSKRHSIEWTLALALAGLILFFPANLFPILTLTTLGLSQSETIFMSVTALYDSHLFAVSALVLMSAIVVPLMKLLLMAYLSGCLLFHKPAPLLSWAMRSYQQLDSWGMLEIYMLGILVSIVKLVDVADVTPGIGLYSLAGLIIVTLLTSTQLDRHRFWRRIEQLERR